MSELLRKCTHCGLEAWTEADLELFQNNKRSKYGKRNQCKKCTSGYMKSYELKPPKPKTAYLRKCKDCGLEAYTQEDLKCFRNDPYKPHGKDMWCVDCYNAWQRPRHYMRARRAKQKEEMIETFEKPLKCYFCKGLITVMEGRTAESFVGHSLDGDHWNFNPENKVPTHRGCHSSWHSTGDRNPKRRNKKKG